MMRIGKSIRFNTDIYAFAFVTQLENSLMERILDVVEGKILLDESIFVPVGVISPQEQ